MDGDQAEDFEFTLAIGGDDKGGIADLLVEQRAADGGSGGDFSGSDVGLLAGDEVVFDFLILGVVKDLDGGTQADLVFGDMFLFMGEKVSQATAELAQRGLNKPL